MQTHFLKKDLRFAGWIGVKHREIQANKELRQLLSPGKMNSFAGKDKKKKSQFSPWVRYCVWYLQITVLQTLNTHLNELLI